MAARDQVFNTYELLENVLSHIKYSDAMRAQQLCKGWHSLSQQSEKLRQAHFLSPKPVEKVQGWDEDPDSPRYGHPCYMWSPNAIVPDRGYYQAVAKVHPLLYTRPGPSPMIVMINHCQEALAVPSRLHILFPHLDRMLSWQQAEGTWEQTLIMQPPCKKIELKHAVFVDSADGSGISPMHGDDAFVEIETIEDGNGVRFGTIVHQLKLMSQQAADRRSELCGGSTRHTQYPRESMKEESWGEVQGFVDEDYDSDIRTADEGHQSSPMGRDRRYVDHE